jgi:hypothetical protein
MYEIPHYDILNITKLVLKVCKSWGDRFLVNELNLFLWVPHLPLSNIDTNFYLNKQLLKL